MPPPQPSACLAACVDSTMPNCVRLVRLLVSSNDLMWAHLDHQVQVALRVGRARRRVGASDSFWSLAGAVRQHRSTCTAPHQMAASWASIMYVRTTTALTLSEDLLAACVVPALSTGAIIARSRVWVDAYLAKQSRFAQHSQQSMSAGQHAAHFSPPTHRVSTNDVSVIPAVWLLGSSSLH